MSNRRILVVDDNEDIRRTVKAILTAHGDEVVTAPDGVTALKEVAEKRPDVILLDIMMPEMNGLEVVERLRQHAGTGSIPVVFLTALDRDMDLIAGYQSGADYYVTKPFTARQLRYAVDLVSTGRSAKLGAASDQPADGPTGATTARSRS